MGKMYINERTTSHAEMMEKAVAGAQEQVAQANGADRPLRYSEGVVLAQALDFLIMSLSGHIYGSDRKRDLREHLAMLRQTFRLS